MQDLILSKGTCVHEIIRESLAFLYRYYQILFVTVINRNSFILSYIILDCTCNLVLDEMFATLDELSVPKDKKKALEKIGAAFSISPLNRNNEDFLLVEAIAILKLFHSKKGKSLQINMKDFLEDYPEFTTLDDEADKIELLEYRNVMSAATQIIPALWNYNHLIDLTARICEGAIRPDGSVVRYVTGSGAKESTKHRVLIYERVGGVSKKARPPRSFDVLMDILRQRSDPINSKPAELTHESSDSTVAIDKGKMEVPIRENSYTGPVRETSYTACPVNNLVVNTQASQNELGLTIQTKSLSKTQLDRSSSDILRSASMTSITPADYDSLGVFDFNNDDQCLSFLDTPLMQGFMMNHESTFTPSGLSRHHVSITQNVSDNGDGAQPLPQEVAQHVHHAAVFPPPIKSEFPSGGGISSSSSMPSPSNLPPSSIPTTTLAPDISAVSAVSTSSSDGGSTTKSKRGRKRKADTAVESIIDPALDRPLTQEDNERYEIITSKLSTFSFDKNGHSQDKGKNPIPNRDFIKKILLPKLRELEVSVKNIIDPRDGTKVLKTFATSLGVDPISRFNDHFLIVEGAAILLLSSRQDRQHLMIGEEEFLSTFPTFANSGELSTLLKYRNMMAAALEIIPAKWNSNHLLDIITRIVEGKETKHITGGGATKQTRRRLDIYLNLGAVEKKVKFYSSALDFLKEGNLVTNKAKSNEKGGKSSKTKATKKRSKRDDFDEVDGNDDSHLELLSQFKHTMDVPSLNLQKKEQTYVHPSLPDVTVNTKEFTDDHSMITCKATTVSREGTDAVTGAPFTLELARGVSISSNYELFNDFDIMADQDNFNNDGSDGVTDMLQDSGIEGIQLHRSTSGSHEGICRTISLTRHVSGEHVIADSHGNFIDVAELTRENSASLLRMPSL